MNTSHPTGMTRQQVMKRSSTAPAGTAPGVMAVGGESGRERRRIAANVEP